MNRRASARRIAAAVAWLCVGGLVGWFARSGMPHEELQSALLATHLVKPASLVHQVYSPEIVHPVEVSAEQEQHLVAWLSKRLNTHTLFVIPGLTPHLMRGNPVFLLWVPAGVYPVLDTGRE